MTVVPFRPKTNSTRPSSVLSAREQSQCPKPPRGIKAIGIDLGTTNSVVSVFTEHLEQPETLKYDDGFHLVPSVIHWDLQSKRELVGHDAVKSSTEDASELIRSTKRQMGVPEQLFCSNGKNYSPEQAAECVLKHLLSHTLLKSEFSEHNGLWAVVTVPAHFDDAARMATLAAANSAGLNVLRIVNEPTAAALAYSMLPDVRDVDRESLVVYDLGGGTFDVSVVERDGLIFNVLASEGDVQLGGDDIDRALAEHLVSFVTPPLAAKRVKEGTPEFKSLLKLAEQAKKLFQTQGAVHIHSEALGNGTARIDTIVERDVFESLATPLIERTLVLTERAIHAARKRPKNISRILLVGGSTRVALVRKMLEQHFPSCMVDARLEPDLAVSWGASIQAAIILGLEPNTILVDVCSHTLGVGVAEDSRSIDENFKRVARKFGVLKPISEEQLEVVLGEKIHDFHQELRGLLRVAPIIHRNSALPSKRSEFFNTLFENQMAVQVIVVQGEGDIVADNRMIGTFLFALEQPCPAGTKCEIQLTYDQNGMVHVLAKQLGTENVAEAVFDSRTGEVTGWVSLLDETVGLAASEDADSGVPELELGEELNDSNVEPQAPHNTLAQGSSQVTAETTLAQPNAVLIKARRQLMRLSNDSQKRDELSLLIRDYESLLSRSLQGEDLDDELDSLEDKFEKF
jgi:molecular chaperone DnaK